MNFKEIMKTGAFGVVYVAKWRGTHVAVKTIKGSLTSSELAAFKSETGVMSKLRPHKSIHFFSYLLINYADIVTFLGVCLNPLCIVTEFMSNGLSPLFTY